MTRRRRNTEGAGVAGGCARETGACPFALQSIHAFLRIATNPRAWRAPLTIEEARAIVDEWLALPNVVTPSPGERHWEILRELMADSQCRGPLVADAVLAALAMEHGAELCTNDRDFSRFSNRRLVKPLHKPGTSENPAQAQDTGRIQQRTRKS